MAEDRLVGPGDEERELPAGPRRRMWLSGQSPRLRKLLREREGDLDVTPDERPRTFVDMREFQPPRRYRSRTIIDERRPPRLRRT
jgi:hypothetical protein